ncbi:hypothetical protein DM02DRAFT_364673 [Periconia macrospinosa]|uniref:Uncharacterized protein n=1 Tax=Periconia macrospinosa TaxID=97972 RepID=A0A2V1D0S1_9PLEO|nr:hypothetical protein DM02DRAFT_364673 [Periconia macrospinosa]
MDTTEDTDRPTSPSPRSQAKGLLVPQKNDSIAVLEQKMTALAEAVRRGRGMAAATNYAACPLQERDATKKAVALLCLSPRIRRRPATVPTQCRPRSRPPPPANLIDEPPCSARRRPSHPSVLGPRAGEQIRVRAQCQDTCLIGCNRDCRVPSCDGRQRAPRTTYGCKLCRVPLCRPELRPECWAEHLRRANTIKSVDISMSSTIK